MNPYSNKINLNHHVQQIDVFAVTTSTYTYNGRHIHT